MIEPKHPPPPSLQYTPYMQSGVCYRECVVCVYLRATQAKLVAAAAGQKWPAVHTAHGPSTPHPLAVTIQCMI